MDDYRNILILSAGTRNKIVQYYIQALEKEAKDCGFSERGKVIAADCSPYAPALYEADFREIVPRIDAPDYLERVLELVARYRARGCFSLIDPELSLLSENAEKFRALGCTPMISPAEAVETSFHKYRMFEKLRELGLRTAACWRTAAEFESALADGNASFPVFVKPENGSASIQIQRVEDAEMLRILTARDPNLMIQAFMGGREYGADVYVDMISGKCVSIFLKRKLKMRAGETDKAVSVHDEALFGEIASFAERMGYRGQLDMDLFLQEDGWYFSEVNPRYGGGYPHAGECGLDMPTLYLNNLRGIENPVRIGAYEDGVVMMKYNDVVILR